METKSEIEIFGENIKNLRINKGLSKKDMSKLLGIGVKKLETLEKGELTKILTIEIVYHIKRNFDYMPSEMLTPGFIKPYK
ncbi:MAG: helix-turn-helix domain-containing protein [Clostridia bacterium]|nr:helix-turn-helix domain-containing protein [Clostridia bacterium]